MLVFEMPFIGYTTPSLPLSGLYQLDHKFPRNPRALKFWDLIDFLTQVFELYLSFYEISFLFFIWYLSGPFGILKLSPNIAFLPALGHSKYDTSVSYLCLHLSCHQPLN